MKVLKITSAIVVALLVNDNDSDVVQAIKLDQLANLEHHHHHKSHHKKHAG